MRLIRYPQNPPCTNGWCLNALVHILTVLWSQQKIPPQRLVKAIVVLFEKAQEIETLMVHLVFGSSSSPSRRVGQPFCSFPFVATTPSFFLPKHCQVSSNIIYENSDNFLRMRILHVSLVSDTRTTCPTNHAWPLAPMCCSMLINRVVQSQSSIH